jgi:hypothetical protein
MEATYLYYLWCCIRFYDTCYISFVYFSVIYIKALHSYYPQKKFKEAPNILYFVAGRDLREPTPDYDSSSPPLNRLGRRKSDSGIIPFPDKQVHCNFVPVSVSNKKIHIWTYITVS